MRQHNIWCEYVTFCVKMCAGLQSGTHLHTERNTSSHRTHVLTPNVMLPHHHIDFYIFNKF